MRPRMEKRPPNFEENLRYFIFSDLEEWKMLLNLIVSFAKINQYFSVSCPLSSWRFFVDLTLSVKDYFHLYGKTTQYLLGTQEILLPNHQVSLNLDKLQTLKTMLIKKKLFLQNLSVWWRFSLLSRNANIIYSCRSKFSRFHALFLRKFGRSRMLELPIPTINTPPPPQRILDPPFYMLVKLVNIMHH